MIALYMPTHNPCMILPKYKRPILGTNIISPATNAQKLMNKRLFLRDNLLRSIELVRAPIPPPIGIQPCRKP